MSNTFNFKATGTQWWIELFEEIENERLTVVKDDCEDFVAQFESKYSRFKPDSLISNLNEQKTLDNPSSELVDILNFGKNMYLRSNTLFNILTGHVQEAKGYDANYTFRSTDRLPESGNPVTDLHITHDKISLDGESKIDIGGFGKGYLIDLLTERLKTQHSLDYFLINGGGDMYATSKHGEPVEIHLEHPARPGTSLGTTTLFHEAFAASSPHKRQWITEHGQQNHIVGESGPASFLKATSVQMADAFATVALLTTQTKMQQFAKAHDLTILKIPS